MRSNLSRALGGFTSFALLVATAMGAQTRARNTPSWPAVNDPAFAQAMGEALGTPFVDGNAARELINGDEVFPAMLAAIRKATNSIHFENFIWRSGRLSDQFIEALSERARAGIQVRLLLDSFGTLDFKNADERRLRDAGVQFVKYNSLWKFWRWNHRTHRKLMIVDGRVGFIGGVCVGDSWLGNAEREPLWRDTHYWVEGPVVAQLQHVFATNWKQTQKEILAGEELFPEITAKGAMRAQCFQSGPGEGEKNARAAYLNAINAARTSIRVGHSYFVPDNASIRALVAARQRGVRVEIITPGVIHANIVRRASRSRWRKLLEAGVEFYEYQPTKYHCKTLIVDDFFVSIGSINFDERSFHLNDEANLNVLDAVFAARQIEVFEADKARSVRVTLDDYKHRSSIWIKCAENLCGLLRPLL